MTIRVLTLLLIVLHVIFSILPMFETNIAPILVDIFYNKYLAKSLLRTIIIVLTIRVGLIINF